MYSTHAGFDRFQLARMQNGIRTAVSTTNSMEMPSTPIL